MDVQHVKRIRYKSHVAPAFHTKRRHPHISNPARKADMDAYDSASSSSSLVNRPMVEQDLDRWYTTPSRRS